MHYYSDAMRNYAVFSGRASCSQYWFFSLALFIMLVVAMIIDQTVGHTTRDEPGGLFTAIYLAHLRPAIAITVRRLHDTDRSGWWILAGLVPLFRQIALLVFMCSPSTPGANRFGSNLAGNTTAKVGRSQHGLAPSNNSAAAPLDQPLTVSAAIHPFMCLVIWAPSHHRPQ
ncbi:DUF805 domain-containing protein [Ochrobactrum sp. EDr1-4]|uniref:DUF805 domain-containing protein n=1 Tax=Ochrobactrum sp. EDr1-4 TaxID=3368622 RepID=UPI003B9DF559